MVAAACIHPFAACCGVELLPGLHAAALSRSELWERSVGSPAIRFECGNLLEDQTEWLHADIIFANSHCFDEEMMMSVSRLAG